MAKSFEGRRVMGMIAVLVVLTAVIPPAAAYGLGRWRIARAGELARAAAGVLSARRDELIAAAGTKGVLCGPGRVPGGEGVGMAWVEAPVAAGRSFDTIWPQDPWGRCYLLDAKGLAGPGGLLISAGANGVIDTPLGASAPQGDDIGLIVR